MKSEFALAFNQICAEYSLPREVVLDAVHTALVTAYRRDWKIASTQNITADVSLDTGLAHIYLEKVVVDSVEDATTQISLTTALKHKPNIQIDEVMMVDVTPGNFGRIAAQTAKQVITQRLREAERESQFNRFSRQENEIIIGTVQSVAPQGVTLHLERTEEALMPRREQIYGERYMLHQKIRVYVLEVRRTSRGPEIIVSRSHPLMLRRLLELEVPEVRGGQVEIKAIAREAGARSKVAVIARQPGLDPIGACVGMRGMRIQTISRELHGERIDVVEWHPEDTTFISNALSMRKVLSVTLDPNKPGGRTAAVVVMDDQLSLAIGRSGQNARLTAKITGWRVDIQGATEAAMWALEQINQNPELVDQLQTAATLLPHLANIMRLHEKDRYPYTDEESKIIKTMVGAVRQAIIMKRDKDRPAARQARARRSAQVQVEEQRRQAKQQARAKVPEAAYTQTLNALNLSTKVQSNLLRNGITSVGEIMERVALGDEALLILDGIGAKAFREIKQAVEEITPTFAAEQTAAVTARAEVAITTDGTTTATELVTAESTGAANVDQESAVMQGATAAGSEVTVPATEVTESRPTIDTATTEIESSDTTEAATNEDEVTELVTPESMGTKLEPIVTYDEEESNLDEIIKSKKKRGKRKSRAVFYDEESGETYVRRQHRRNQSAWDDYGDDF